MLHGSLWVLEVAKLAKSPNFSPRLKLESPSHVSLEGGRSPLQAVVLDVEERGRLRLAFMNIMVDRGRVICS
jgi:hypothetical protein